MSLRNLRYVLLLTLVMTFVMAIGYRWRHRIRQYVGLQQTNLQLPSGWIVGTDKFDSETKNSPVYYKKTFKLSSLVLAELQATTNGLCTCYLNGSRVNKIPATLEAPLRQDVTSFLRVGENVIAFEVTQAMDPAALIANLRIIGDNVSVVTIETDCSWHVSTNPGPSWNRDFHVDTHWDKPRLFAKYGEPPFGDVFDGQKALPLALADIKIVDGFAVDRIMDAEVGQGSWAAMTIDDKGRFFIAPEPSRRSSKIIRVSVNSGSHHVESSDVNVPVHSAMGLLWAFDSLFACGKGPDGSGIYRITDTDNDDRLDAVKLLRKLPDRSLEEHGVHAIVRGPDNNLYIAFGNAVPALDNLSAISPYRNWREAYLTPQIKNPTGIFNYMQMPHGCIYRTDVEGKRWELVAARLRNNYDIAFNKDGELFTFDSDMDWDVGLAWYRPTRILHVTSGAEFGFREGSSILPDYYPDVVGTVVNVGRGSPTGLSFGTRSNFPESYANALFAMDWTYGRILAIHLHPLGSSYAANHTLPSRYELYGPTDGEDVELFLQGKGLPVTDLEFGKDGAMYFITGGRNTKSSLYRVTYRSSIDKERESDSDPTVHAEGMESRNVRKMLEKFHGRPDPSAIDIAWPFLGSSDRAIRYAARLAVEAQPITAWKNRAFAEADSWCGLTAMLSIARIADRSDQPALLLALSKFPLRTLNEEAQIAKLRILELSFTNQGRPNDEFVKTIDMELNQVYPSQSFKLNRELSQLLVWLKSSDVVPKTLALLDTTPERAEQVWFANVLRNAKNWTSTQRVGYFDWLHRAGDYEGGASFRRFINQIREDATGSLSAEERKSLDASIGERTIAVQNVESTVTRPFQKEWKVAELLVDGAIGSGDRTRGKEIFRSLQCGRCHRFGNDFVGGGIGPDLTGIRNRFNQRDLLESIIEPSKIISDQYRSTIIRTSDGAVVSGVVADDDGNNLTVIVDALTGQKKMILKSDVENTKASDLSSMPSGLINVLKQNEVSDLLSYLETF